MNKTFSSIRVTVPLLVILLAVAVSCGRQAPPPAAPPTPPLAPGKQGVTFGEGFYNEEVTPSGGLRWARQDASLRVEVPDAGRYRLTFRPFVGVASVENTLGVSVNGQSVGQLTTNTFNVVNPAPFIVETPLRAGGNDVHIHGTRSEVPLGKDDPRMTSFGLVLPVTAERVP